MNGDYTETAYGDTKNTTTSSQSMSLDFDIGPSSNPTVESSSPYSVNIFSGGGYQAVQTSSNYIWFDFNSNNPNGFNFHVRSENEGLYSATANALIPSEDEDLSTDSNNNGGYGIKIFNENNTQETLGPLIKSTNYDTSGANYVGAVSNLNKLIFSTNDTGSNRGEILNGRGAIILKAKTRITTPVAGDYSDELFFTIVGDF